MIWDKHIKKRILGLYGDMLSDQLIIVMAGIHGNEHSGALAIKNVLRYLQENQVRIKGCFLGLKGNIAAMEQNKRFIDQDLNRLWSQEQMTRIQKLDPDLLEFSEEKEQREIMYLLGQFLSHRSSQDPFLFIDLHTTSAESGHFIIVNEHEKSKSIAHKLPVPAVSGLTSVLRNTTLEMFSDRAYAAIAYEAGQHENKEAINRMEAMILLSMHHLGLIVLSVFEIDQFQKFLYQVDPAHPRKTVFSYRHEIKEDDQFEMLPGFHNFQKVSEGQVIAQDKTGDIRVKEDGCILMPLYQKQGDDGFFIIREHT